MALPAGVNLILVLLLVPRYGLRGAVWATTASYALGLLASALLGRRAIALPVPWATLGQVAIATVSMAVAVTLVPGLGGVAELLAKSAVGAATYAAVVLALDAGGARGRLALALRQVRHPPVETGSVA
jgi:O-antigen/teichoic acid export membrane protein